MTLKKGKWSGQGKSIYREETTLEQTAAACQSGRES